MVTEFAQKTSLHNFIYFCTMDENINVKDDELLEDVDDEKEQRARNRKTKGRGFGQQNSKDQEDRYAGSQANFETMEDNSKSGVVKCNVILQGDICLI